MQMQITARRFNADDALKDYVSKKLSKLKRYYDGITEARVVLSDEGTPGNSKSAEVIMRVYQQTLSATGNGVTHQVAIDECVDALRRQLKKYKAKLRAKDKDYHK